MFVIRAADLPIKAEFFAAIDACGLVCWTDDRARARQFDSYAEAQQFALDRMSGDAWQLALA